ncbi:hypothetical protein B0H14DRAFT_1452277 [Mycena olivaceomarginata]|nr:hypothetical protein B0H14DRAFT_1452277 [Mycena olivaceomarginata]
MPLTLMVTHGSEALAQRSQSLSTILGREENFTTGQGTSNLVAGKANQMKEQTRTGRSGRSGSYCPRVQLPYMTWRVFRRASTSVTSHSPAVLKVQPCSRCFYAYAGKSLLVLTDLLILYMAWQAMLRFLPRYVRHPSRRLPTRADLVCDREPWNRIVHAPEFTFEFGTIPGARIY